MRFRVKDLLLLTALLSVYLAAFVHIYNSAESGLFLRAGMKIFVVTFLGSHFVFVVLHRRWSLGRVQPIKYSLHAPIPWGHLALSLSTVLLIAIVMQSIDSRTGVALFVGGSTPILASLIRSFLLCRVPVSHKGIVYLNSLIPWNKMVVARDQEGTLQHIRIGKSRWSPVLGVPPELREQIQQIIPKDTTEANP